MGLFPFSNKPASETRVEVPSGYKHTTVWSPHIGDIFPNFWAKTTHGPISFHSWAEGSWVFLFSHPAAFTPVCTTEIADFNSVQDAFAARQTKVIGMSHDDCATQAAWLDDIGRVFNMTVGFPMIEDPEGLLAATFGMVHPKEHPEWSIRKSFIIDPALRLRMIFEYPIWIGRSTIETLRVIDAMQVNDRYNVGTPADWEPGDPCLLPSDKTDAQLDFTYGPVRTKVRKYLQTMLIADIKDRH